MSKRCKCRAPGCTSNATKGAYWWKTIKSDRFVWATFCDEHAIVAIMKGAAFMPRRPRYIVQVGK